MKPRSSVPQARVQFPWEESRRPSPRNFLRVEELDGADLWRCWRCRRQAGPKGAPARVAVYSDGLDHMHWSCTKNHTGYFAGVECKLLSAAPPGFRAEESFLQTHYLRPDLLVLAALHGLVRPVIVRPDPADPAAMFPVFRPTTPQRFPRDMMNLRSELAVARAIG